VFVKIFGSTKKRRTGCGLHSLVTTIKRKICTPKFDVFSFVLRTPCTPVTCTPGPKDAKNNCLQNGLCDLVLLFPGCCKFGLPVPLFCFISWCSSKPFRLPPSSCPLLSSMPLLPTYAVYTRTSTYALPTLNAIVRAEA